MRIQQHTSLFYSASFMALAISAGCGTDTSPPGLTVDTVNETGGTIDAAGDSGTDAATDTAATDTAATDTAVTDTATTDTATTDTATTDTTTTDTATFDATADAAPDATAGIQCGQAPVSFPTFAKACAADADCFVAQHQINCCGTKIAIGLHTSEKAAFAAAEATCQSQYPGCGCAQFETVAEDGYAAFDDAAFKAVCAGGSCKSTVPAGVPVCIESGLQKPVAPKACAQNADCTYLLQTIDCCGSQKAVGIQKSAKDAFEAIEVKCAQQMSVCDCLPKPVVMEDGQNAGSGLIAVECDSGYCMTWAK